jgi:glycosyltransferase involved in cell wall biosynthesis
MNIAYIGHGYHEKTKSSQFMIEFLRQHARKVDLFFDYSTIGGAGIDPDAIAQAGYDLIVVWQMEPVAAWFAQRVPDRLVFVPMYDNARHSVAQFWLTFRKSRVLNFSHAWHEFLQPLEVPTLRVQYFPDPSAFSPVDFSAFHGFLWQRGQDIAWPLVKRLSAGTAFASFTLHLALDPGCGESFIPNAEDMQAYNVTLSRWREDHAEIDEILAKSNIYFAPRLYEGIGMSFLEAMARGQCVVASDTPTMSEYMTHGISGLLYDQTNPQALDFSKAVEIGAAARRKVERGFAQWQRDQRELLPEFFFEGREKALAMLKRISLNGPHHCVSAREDRVLTPVSRREGGRRLQGHARADRPNELLVTIAIVTRDACETFAPTLDCILSQTYGNFEVLVVDGASQDDTRALIEDRDETIDYWISEPDQGPYDGMNKAARLAQGRYILFMNAGDLFASERALAEAMEGISETHEPDFVIGHHFYVTKDGIEQFHKANDFESTWRMMREGAYSWPWLSGVPCHQATLTRTALLRDNAYDLSWQIAADHEFMYRMRAKGARFHHCDTTLAIYFGGGFSSQNEALCHLEWWQLARTYGEKSKADLWFGGMHSQISSELARTKIELQQEKNAVKQLNMELEQANINFQKTHIDLQKTNIDLEKTNIIIRQTNIDLQRVNIELEKTNIDLQIANIELEKTNIDLHQTDTALQQTTIDLQETNVARLTAVERVAELERGIDAIERTRVWRAKRWLDKRFNRASRLWRQS